VKAIAPLLVLAALLASCAAPQRPAPQPPAPVVSTPPPAPAPAPLPPPPADWRDAAQTPGSWRWSWVDGISVAEFGVSRRTDALATLLCDPSNKRVLLMRATDPLRPAPATPLQVVTTSMSRPMLSDPALSTGGWLIVSLPVNDPLLDAIAFSRGRFALEAAERATLYLPSSPELSRVVEDCR
jgi:hypothetical protein